MNNIEEYKKIQSIAKKVLNDIFLYINSNSTEETIINKTIELLKAENITGTWYYNIPALVLLGNRSCLSVSGKDYQPSNEKVGNFNLITIDLSPIHNNIWGDCARTYFIENGKCVWEPTAPIFKAGKQMLASLHRKISEYISPNTSFSELFNFGNNQIKQDNFENLDFMKNLGHTIETNLTKRFFIDSNCHEKIGRKLFTFEPHIRKKNTTWGFKHEEIYYFDENNRLRIL